MEKKEATDSPPPPPPPRQHWPNEQEWKLNKLRFGRRFHVESAAGSNTALDVTAKTN